MANKSVTIVEPVVGDIGMITIVYSGGVAQAVEISAAVQSMDSSTRYNGNTSTPATDYTAGEQTAMNGLATAALAKFIAVEGF